MWTLLAATKPSLKLKTRRKMKIKKMLTFKNCDLTEMGDTREAEGERLLACLSERHVTH